MSNSKQGVKVDLDLVLQGLKICLRTGSSDKEVQVGNKTRSATFSNNLNSSSETKAAGQEEALSKENKPKQRAWISV